ncbi:DUF1254 domain-containing protein [Maritalea mediterranea]|uniref:DUF1254 domain-containing protein n=1 Tax=Maritalea mediterranea TaxID=2909667 RepID=A0ABS9E938_9HYPH|nr:hypothetical protein [Maritalea mediterranea]MCF4097923.1 hypothetical protein [Maritalea mediterranea]
MGRFALWFLAGLILGGIIHLSVILLVPNFAERDAWSRLAKIAPDQAFIALDHGNEELARALQLDPALSYGVCQFDLARGPMFIDGKLPHSFWSIAVAARDGRVIYSTTSRAGSGDEIKIGVFNPAQSRLLAEEGLDIGQGFLIVNAPSDQLTAIVRLWPDHDALRQRYDQALESISCTQDSVI